MRSKKAIYNISTSILLQIITILYGFIVPKIIISFYGSSTNGLLASITQLLAYISLLDSGFTSVVKAELYKPIASKDENKINSILIASDHFFKKIAYIFIIYVFILAFIYPYFVPSSFDYWTTLTLIIIISISSLAEYYFGMVYKLYLQAEQRSYVISIIQIVTYFFAIILTILLAKIRVSILLLKLFTGLVFIVRPLFQNIYVKKHFNINMKENTTTFKLKNKWDGLAQHIASVIHNNTDVTILTFFCNLMEVSVYSVYYMVVRGIKSIVQSFTSGIDSSFGDMLAKKEIINLNNKFNVYETIFFSLATIIFSCTIILITPFIIVYTKGVNDVNYVRYIFGYLIVISEFIWVIRLPYSSLVLAAGHFRETRIGAWVECLTNILLSLFLVYKYGIIGVAIGTIIAMTIRTIEFIIHCNRSILIRNCLISFRKVFIVIIETMIIFIIHMILPQLEYHNYLDFIYDGIITFILASFVVFIINFILYKNDFRKVFEYIKRRCKKNVRKN